MTERQLNLLKRNKKALQKVIAKQIFEEVRGYIAIPGNDITKNDIVQAQALGATLESNAGELKQLNDKILDLLTEDEEVEKEMEEAMTFNIEMAKYAKMLEEVGSPTAKVEMDTERRRSNRDRRGSEEEYVEKPRSVKLPTLNIASFDGNPLQWQTFIDTFEASVHQRKDLSDVQKFQYLTGYLEKAAKKCLTDFHLQIRTICKHWNC